MRCSLGAIVLAVLLGACRPAPNGDQHPPSGQPPTFATDIAPILYAHCVTCHRPGQAAPFSLIEYADVKSRADKIKTMTGSHRMPPWLPEPGEFAFVGERRLSADDIALIRRWVDSGAPQGDPAATPAVPAFPDGWQLGQPDLVATMPKAYTLPAGKGDHYRQVVLPLSLPGGRFVRAVEFRAGGAPVHHAVIRVDRTHASRRRDGTDGAPGFDGVMAPADVQNPDGHFVGWTPGQGPILSPSGMPWRLEKENDLVVELHLIPGAAPVAVQPAIGLFFTDQPPTATPVELTMGVKTIDIPAGATSHRVTEKYTFPVEVTLLSLYPHAHYLGKDVQVIALLPDGAVKRLLHIPEWEFHWQQEYRFAAPVILPAGTTLTMQYTYDNSATNDDNPSKPPKRVLYGARSTDEMANLAMQVLPRSPSDGRMLVKAFAARSAQADVASAEMLVRIDPNDGHHQWWLGRSYVEVGRTAEAIAPLEAAVRIDPSSASAHDYLGRALFAERRPADALVHLQRAVALSPNDEVFQIDLGKVLVETGRVADGLQALRRALAINPEFSQGYQSLGVALVRTNQLAGALEAFRRAVALTPESADAHNGLGVALAQSGQRAEALQHLQKAVELDPDNASAKDNLNRLQRPR